jgi:flagellar hook-length control protein FliK
MFNALPLPKPDLHKPLATSAGTAPADETADTTATAGSFADLLIAAGKPPRPTQAESGDRRADVHDGAAPTADATSGAGTTMPAPLWPAGWAPPAPAAAPVVAFSGTEAPPMAAANLVTNVAPATADVPPIIPAAAGATPAVAPEGLRAPETARRSPPESPLEFAAARPPRFGSFEPPPTRVAGTTADSTNGGPAALRAPAEPVAPNGVGDAAIAAPSPVDVRFASGVEPALRLRADHTVGSPGWADEVAQKLAYVVRLGRESAELHVQPANLGPIDIRIILSGDQASVQLVAAHAATREALEDALPLLRDLLANQGLALGQTAVESGAQERSWSGDAPRDGRAPAPDGHRVAIPPARITIGTLRLVDVFA